MSYKDDTIATRRPEMPEPERAQRAHSVHFFVDKTKVTSDEDDLTGLQIKELAGVDLTDLLELRQGDERVPVPDNKTIEVNEGSHFKTYPGGKDS
jgi:hypothetical protein